MFNNGIVGSDGTFEQSGYSANTTTVSMFTIRESLGVQMGTQTVRTVNWPNSMSSLYTPMACGWAPADAHMNVIWVPTAGLGSGTYSVNFDSADARLLVGLPAGGPLGCAKYGDHLYIKEYV